MGGIRAGPYVRKRIEPQNVNTEHKTATDSMVGTFHLSPLPLALHAAAWCTFFAERLEREREKTAMFLEYIYTQEPKSSLVLFSL